MPIKNYPVRLNAISMFFDRAFKIKDAHIHVLEKEYTESEWKEFGESEYDNATDVLLDYQEIVIRSILGELNALVEYELKWMAKSILRKHQVMPIKVGKKLSREKACEIIEKEYCIKFKDLPGYAGVDEIRKVVNAYKHDDGYSGEYEPLLSGFVEKKYELDLDKIEKYLSSVEDFLQSLPGQKLNLGEDVRVKF